ncbi:hypothetical protein FX988_00104 [Paraglaciecola mesophila]|uniref:Carboxyvinyl-carboxyphosphonate phosphorylmutase n=1 Tax=Paraglaciecola mesophila TaxID=197222 RepID=A0A857JDY6_9ALTE|nr:isocitrate lyase/phosphoenolpyruvate mutase family protein [Paraglaciecola mesophila]QHJ09896.1 hypothetical protein FX988_00104 [Paraglaciecola mesophila]
MTFRALHQQQEPLIICNVWDVPSAQLGEKLGYKALGTSSAAIARMLGVNDGEQVLFSELIYLVKRILSAVNVPLTVDIESGYGRSSEQVANNLLQLARLGVAGVNIEDSRVTTVSDGQPPQRVLQSGQALAKVIKEVKHHLCAKGIDMFLNVRTDTYLLGGGDNEQILADTQARIALYQQAGADGIFVPGVMALPDIRAIVNTTDLPVNVMCMPGLANFTELKACGVKRISMGNFVYENMLGSLATTLTHIREQGSFDSLFQ